MFDSGVNLTGFEFPVCNSKRDEALVQKEKQLEGLKFWANRVDVQVYCFGKLLPIYRRGVFLWKCKECGREVK